MANRTYANFWTRDRSEAMMLDRFERLLETVPRSQDRPRFANLVIRAVDRAEIPLAENDLGGTAGGPADVIALAREYRNGDTEYEVEGYWDLSERDADTGRWRRLPERLVLTCTGEAFDGGAAAEQGDFAVDLGLEHLYTGHANLLGLGARSAPSDPIEAEFLALMMHEERLHEYYERTRENIQQLLSWVRAVEQALPVAQYRLWSEGEENFEARLDEILAAR